jgi:erythromycin esterase
MTSGTNPAATGRDVLLDWIREHARPLQTVDPSAPLTDLGPLRELVRHATVVGLGGSTRGAHELFALQHRVLTFLVEEMGFRTLALEMDWTQGIPIDAYLCTGRGELSTLLADARPFWRIEELLEAVRWMRAYNQRHPTDPVRFVGVDIVGVQALAYDAVIDYARRTAPERLVEIEALYAPLRPTGGIDLHVQAYRARPDKQPLIDRARAACHLVESLPPSDERSLALQHARTIVGFYELHALDDLGYVEQRLAENTIWWQQSTGHKIVYWGGMAHTVSGTTRTASTRPIRRAGSYLRDRFGRGYVSIGLIFDHGTLTAYHGSGPYQVPAPPPDFADSPLGDAGLDAYVLDLRTPPSDAARSWLHAPAKARLIGPIYDPDNDAAFHMSGGSLVEWFDAIIHCRAVTPTHLLT